MARLSLGSLGPMLKEKRHGRGLREVSAEIGISSATLSRVENGKVPDLDTFSKICKWLGVDPSEVLGCPGKAGTERKIKGNMVFAHLRADKNLDKETIQALAEMILRARKIIAERMR